jgi:hypothetical protein
MGGKRGHPPALSLLRVPFWVSIFALSFP